MKKLFLLFVLILCPSLITAQDARTPVEMHRDSLRQVIRRGLYDSPDRCLQLADSLEADGLFSKGEAALEKSIIYDFLGENRMALLFARQAYDDQKAMADKDFSFLVMETLIEGNIAISDFESAMQYVVPYLEAATENGSDSQKAYANYDYALILYRSGNVEEGLKYYEKAFKTLEGSGKPRDLADLSFLYGEYVSLMLEEDNLADALKISLLREKIIRQMEGMKGIPEGYLDQQLGYMYSKLALIYARTGNHQDAARCYQAFSETEFSKSPQGISYGIPYLTATGMYSKSISDCKTILEMMDTVSLDWVIHAYYLADAYFFSGDYKNAASLYETIDETNRKLDREENSSLVKEMSAVYGIQERDQEIHLQKETIKNQKLLAYSLSAIVAILLLFVWYIYRNLHILNAQNRKLYEQIENSQLQKKEQEAKKASEPYKRNPNTKLDAALERIISTKRFTAEGFDRKAMAQEMGTNEYYLNSYIKEISDLPTASYISVIRLEYSLELMAAAKQTHETIDKISFECGFSNIRTFQRLFKSKYGITPSEYMRFRCEE